MTSAVIRVASRFLLASKYAYHGTSTKVLENIQKRGLMPGASSSYSDRYSEYDDGNHLFFSDDADYLRGAYGDTIVRFPWPGDAKPDMNAYGRYLPHQFATKKAISPKDIEVEVDGKWVAIEDLPR